MLQLGPAESVSVLLPPLLKVFILMKWLMYCNLQIVYTEVFNEHNANSLNKKNSCFISLYEPLYMYLSHRGTQNYNILPMFNESHRELPVCVSYG